MNEVQGLILTRLSRALAEAVEEPIRQGNFRAWRILLAVTVLLFSFVTLPAEGSREINLTTQNILTLLNQDRARLGLFPLRENEILESAAIAKARDILAKSYFAHVSPDGARPWDFIKQASLEYAFAGENLAINYRSAYELQHDFLESPSHRENLLSPLFTDIGIAILQGSFRGEEALITVQMFATPK